MTHNDPFNEGNGPWYINLYTHNGNCYAGRIIGTSPADAEEKAEFIVTACNAYADSQRKIGDLQVALEITADALCKVKQAIGVGPIELSDPEKRPLLIAIHQAETSARTTLKSTE